MKKIMNAIRYILISVLLVGLISCEDLEKDKGGIFSNPFFPILFEQYMGSMGQQYDNACDNNSLSTPLTLNSPVFETSFGTKYRYLTGATGLKYSLTLSGDYPTCGAEIRINNCSRPNQFASNSIVSCNSGTYTSYVSGGTQTCTISSFSNQLLIILVSASNSQYPNTPCATVKFEVVP
ncbi:putative lipoprotein [Leptospira kirschneri str. 200803703]|uniref:hypothetical protein n=1 Tax=Leptospira kirschneri TaxID=29507 RepID=UPI0002BDBF58|nr:hypothetical protein [Leptospira kirschneri]EMO68662.1 putative lipoprotein [Leptospira kirschneri str. 200803703]